MLSPTELQEEVTELKPRPVCSGRPQRKDLAGTVIQSPRFSLKPMSWIFMLLGSFADLAGRTEPKLR